jgi:REP element-mobilizing transposase RayT
MLRPYVICGRYLRENGYRCVPPESHRLPMDGPWHPRVSMHRRSIRLRGRDYSAPGTYLLTICACSHLFGRVQTGVMILSRFGEIARECWTDLPNHFSHVRLDAFIVMPDHVHGILVVGRRSGRASAIGRIGPGSLGAVVRSFKSAVTARINSERGARPGGIWQRNYFDQIIRSRADLDRVRRYIRDNPVRWDRKRRARLGRNSATYK